MPKNRRHAGPNSGRSSRFNRPRDWQAFERLTRDLFSQITLDFDADLHGRSGQPQAGVDVICTEQRSRLRVGIQCRGREDDEFGANARATVRELKEEVAKAKTFFPTLDKFIFLTTGGNDAKLKRAAAQLTEENRRMGSFEVQFHGWDWIEAQLCEHIDLAISYGLTAVVAVSESAQAGSRISRQIGARLSAAIDMMNQNRSVDEHFTLQSLSCDLDMPDWRRLEQITEGKSDAGTAGLTTIADGLGVSAKWLLEGKGAAFYIDHQDRGADDQFEFIKRDVPLRVIFFRDRDAPNDSSVVIQLNEIKWATFSYYHPAGPNVGGTGRRQLFEYVCLMRQIYRELKPTSSGRCYGRHLNKTDYERLVEGEIYPGALLTYFHNDHWWDDFAELADHRVEGEELHNVALRKAIQIARGVLHDFQESAQRVSHIREFLISVGLPPKVTAFAADYDLDAGTARARA